MEKVSPYLPWIVSLIVLLSVAVLYKFFLRIFGIVIIPEDMIGVMNKKFVLFGPNKTLPDGAIIALQGEAGYQADTLAPGLHFWLWPWQYEVEKGPFITIGTKQIGIVEARDGKSLKDGKVLAKKVECDSYQNARKFLENGGERGPQIAIIPPGTYRINTRIFTVKMVEMTEIPDNKVGIVTTQEGKPLNTENGDIAGKEVPNHNSFQDGQAFVDNGGFKGLQEQVILAGRYYINPAFATVEMKDMTQIPIAEAGVVVAYVGDKGEDTSGASFQHGNLVTRGKKGVWDEPYDPGKYPVNVYTHKIELVPTANIVLNWANGKTEAHKLDEKLCTITVRSSDGFTFNLDVSQIIHIPRNEAPKVIARFGTVSNMVTQVLEPIIGNYFRNTAQSSDVIDFLKGRDKRQQEAKAAIATALKEYNVLAVDTLIGDITPPEELMKTLTDRKLAEQREITYGTQKKAEEMRKDLEQAKSIADTQSKVVDAERTVSINEFKAAAKIKEAEGDKQAKILKGEGEAAYTKITGEADASRINAVGKAEADVIELKIDSMEAGNYAAIQVAEALGKSGIKWVPEIVIGGGTNGKGNGTIADVLMANMLNDNLKKSGSASVVKKTEQEKALDNAEDKSKGKASTEATE